jgi:hypothetical protein
VHLRRLRQGRRKSALVGMSDLTTFCGAFTIRTSTAQLERQCVASAIRTPKNRVDPAWPPTRRAWRGAVFVVRRSYHHGKKPMPQRHGLKRLIGVNPDQQFTSFQLAATASKRLHKFRSGAKCVSDVWLQTPNSTSIATATTSRGNAAPRARTLPSAKRKPKFNTECVPVCPSVPSTTQSTLAIHRNAVLFSGA